MSRVLASHTITNSLFGSAADKDATVRCSCLIASASNVSVAFEIVKAVFGRPAIRPVAGGTEGTPPPPSRAKPVFFLFSHKKEEAQYQKPLFGGEKFFVLPPARGLATAMSSHYGYVEIF